MGSTGAVTAERAGERHGVADASGLAVLAACAAWALITSALGGGRPDGVLLAILAVAAGYAGGRITGALLPVAAPCAGALAGVCLAAAAPHVTPGPASSSPLGPIGATAALLSLSAGAICCAAWAARGPALRLCLRLAALGVVGCAAALGSTAGFLACAGIVLCSLAASLTRRTLGLAGFALASVLVAGASWAIAEDVLPRGLTASLEGQLGPHRVRLWRDAGDLVGAHPAFGVGPGRFGDASPSVMEGLLQDGRPHSALLQQAAEQGFTGVALLTAAFAWLLFALWRSPRSTAVVLTAGAALTSVAAVATLGNALSVTSVTAGAGLLAGIATARPLQDGGEADGH
ncbi:O-antigen ligase family protein [Streptomyces spectabilis]|uniref:O-antigen ligase domain-containing protein n=1 Tax=Streptomyces spectabilis TaxID=68270 RepID=A0A5P2XL89_STRST|nr:O-antigen ligase family protein [Streptomyces spectabilis]MBB5101971.1 hypothetical protein [Streptomyces spectabilis]MCI3907023.1 O-antigen ligase family protein [Streptomyces spectabilis]QEV63800.1 O-antigen ligase domain-containing protein [Streptomyces spectabilis]GGV35438.1 hypothetical protein GCM10010245_56800 [Streptomyces spectabilis]